MDEERKEREKKKREKRGKKGEGDKVGNEWGFFLAFVAAGRYDAFFEFGLQPWDVAAGLLLVREAGGVICDISGKPYEMGGLSLLASNFALRDSMVEVLSTA